MLRLRISFLHRHGYLSGGPGWRRVSWTINGDETAVVGASCSRDRVHLRYSIPSGYGRMEALDYSIPVVWTPCHFGGERPWFLCPRCDRRSAVLYSSGCFLCRICQDVAYASQGYCYLARTMNRCHRLERKLGVESPTGMGWAPRPKGMHHKTYNRLLRALERAEFGWESAFTSRYDMPAP